MKINDHHYGIIESAINGFLAKLCQQNNCSIADIVDDYEVGDFPNHEFVKDLNKRFRWDLFYGAGLSKFVCDEIYKYANDEHIDTVLRQVCPQGLERRY